MKIWTFKGVGSHWFLNQNQKNLFVPHIVPRVTANNMLLHKIQKNSAKSTHRFRALGIDRAVENAELQDKLEKAQNELRRAQVKA